MLKFEIIHYNNYYNNTISEKYICNNKEEAIEKFSKDKIRIIDTKDYIQSNKKKKQVSKKIKPIDLFTSEGKYIRSFASSKHAADVMLIDPEHIRSAIREGYRVSKHNNIYLFKHIDLEKFNIIFINYI